MAKVLIKTVPAAILLLLLAVSSLLAAPAGVEKALAQRHAEADVAGWELNSDGNWEATFHDLGVTYRAEFTPRGEWVSTKNSIELDQLPEKVGEAVDRALDGQVVVEVESIDHAVHGRVYAIWIENLGELRSALYREDGTLLNGILKLRDPQKHPEVMEVLQLVREVGFNLLTILIFAWFLYYRRHHDHEMLFLLLGFNMFLFPIFLVSNNLTTGIGFTIFALLALVRLRSDTFSKTEIAYLLGAVALTFINAQLASRPQMISASIVLLTVYVADHPRLWRDANKTVHIRYRMKKTESMLNPQVLRARIERDYQVKVTDLKIESVQSEEVRLSVIYRQLPPDRRNDAAVKTTSPTPLT